MSFASGAKGEEGKEGQEGEEEIEGSRGRAGTGECVFVRFVVALCLIVGTAGQGEEGAQEEQEGQEGLQEGVRCTKTLVLVSFVMRAKNRLLWWATQCVVQRRLPLGVQPVREAVSRNSSCHALVVPTFVCLRSCLSSGRDDGV